MALRALVAGQGLKPAECSSLWEDTKERAAKLKGDGVVVVDPTEGEMEVQRGPIVYEGQCR